MVFSIIIYVLTFVPYLWLCISDRDCNNSCSVLLAIDRAGIVVPAVTIPVVLYALLYIKAKRIKREVSEVMAMSSSSRKSWKATVTFFVLFFSVFIMIVPTLIVLAITNIVYGERDLPPAINALNVTFSSVSSLVIVTDPIIIMWNRDVRIVVGKIMVKIVQNWKPSFRSKTETLNTAINNTVVTSNNIVVTQL